MSASKKTLLFGLVALLQVGLLVGAEANRRTLPGHVPAVVHRLAARGVLADTNELFLAIGLPLRDPAGLNGLIHQLYDPGSTNFHRFLTPAEFTARFGPTDSQYLAVQQFARDNGFTIVDTHPNRLVLDVRARAVDVQRAFQITLRAYRHPVENRDFFAPDTEPSVNTNLPVVDIEGLNNYSPPKPLSHPMDPKVMAALRTTALSGTGPNGLYAGNDFRKAYVPNSPLTGAGQTVGLFQFSDYSKSDITNYERMIGRTNFIDVTNVVLRGGTPDTSGNNETALDIEMAIAMAPQLSHIIVYEEKSVNPASLLSRMAQDNFVKQFSSSWSWSGGPDATVDSHLLQMIAQGQSYFQASGDTCAYTGPEALDNASQTTSPMDSTNLTCVGGTTLTMNGQAVSYFSEQVWNYTPFGAPYLNEGSSGGVSSYYTIPAWQAGINTNSSQGSATFRNIPDVALTGDGVSVVYTSGTSITNGAAGTSCAAPLWAGLCALLNQQSIANSGTSVGFLNPALYSLAAGPNYTNCFHDIKQGSNIGTNTPGEYNATNGYDLATGLGTPNGMNFINALAPLPAFLTQPLSQTVTNGANVILTAVPLGAAQWSFQWLFNGTNLPAGGNASGVNTNTLVLTSVSAANAGNYSLVFTNPFGTVTSSVAVLTTGFAPIISMPPTNLTLLAGSTALFSAMVSGSGTLAYQWQKNGTNVLNGANVTGATSTNLTLTSITTNSTGNYTLIATNIFGVNTSSVASLTVVLPPTITASSLTNRTFECGANVTNTIVIAGTTPLFIQWSVDAVPVPGATSTSLILTAVHPPSHVLSVTATNQYASVTSNATLTVNDTQPPVITLNGPAVMTNELGHAFTDPGATANDLCAGPQSVTTNGAVNVNVIGSTIITYTAGDGNGNTNTVTRTVVVRDTTPPAISWTFTNLTLVADANCQAFMTNVTGTNFIQATDASGTLVITQIPTNSAPLSIGTNAVVITVMDLSSNASFSTNTIVVLDQTPPTITLSGATILTNELGQPFIDPGVIAADTCAGAVTVTTNGTVNINAIGTNILAYIATDLSGNTNSVTRTIVVVDTTPPAIAWSFTNLFLPLDTNCSATMPDVTGTNYILATDLSPPLTYAQSIVTNTALTLGTNIVVIIVTDAAGNAAFSTNFVIVVDTNLPVITSQPQSLTNNAGSMAAFTVAATACTPISYQWLFNGITLTNQFLSSLTLSNIAAAQAGNYSVIVTSSGGAITSAVAILDVDLLPDSLTLVSSANPDGYLDALTFSAGVAPTNATGTIQFLTNGTAFDMEVLTNGIAASTNLTSLPRGTNSIEAIYSGNAFYLPATNLLAQVVTNHPPQVTSVTYTLTAGLNLEIPVADLATNWSDVDGDPLTIASISTSTNGIAITNTMPALFYSDTNDVNDQFAVQVTDGFGGTNSQEVNIVVVPQTNATPVIAGITTGTEGITLTLSGGYNSTYVLQASTNLTGAWQPLVTNQFGITGMWIFTDTQATNYPQEFYRLELQP